MVEVKQKILIVEDDLDVANLLNTYFRAQGYEVFTASMGEKGVLECQSSHPDVVILDIRLPDIDGYEVARRLRSNHRTADIPIIFLTEKRARSDRYHGLELGADDYIPKPFDVQELELRVRNALRRAEQDSLTNTVTGLPDGRLVDERISDCLNRLDWSMLIVSLENLDIFRESYGFVASDDALRAVSVMLQNAMKEFGSQDDFLGHTGTTNFVLITENDRAAILQQRIRIRLEQSLDYFYPIKDREKIVVQNKRLSVQIGMLQGGEANYTSLDDLKIALLRKKNREQP
jgi:DNA-binding response OmpR family regulator